MNKLQTKGADIYPIEPEILEANGLDKQMWNAINATVFPGAKPESIFLALAYCKERGLDILKKPCHIVPLYVKDPKTGRGGFRDVVMPSIQEYRITAMRTQCYAGIDEPIFGNVVEMNFGGTIHKVPESCKITVYRLVAGTRVPFTHSERFEAACQVKKSGELNAMWSKRGWEMLAKCVEAGALRKAFPEEVGGLPTGEESLVDLSGDSKPNAINIDTLTPTDDPKNPFKEVEVEETPEPAPEPAPTLTDIKVDTFEPAPEPAPEPAIESKPKPADTYKVTIKDCVARMTEDDTILHDFTFVGSNGKARVITSESKDFGTLGVANVGSKAEIAVSKNDAGKLQLDSLTLVEEEDIL